MVDRVPQRGDRRGAQVDDGSALGDEALYLIAEGVRNHADHDDDGSHFAEDVGRTIGNSILEVPELMPTLLDDFSVACRHPAAAADDDDGPLAWFALRHARSRRKPRANARHPEFSRICAGDGPYSR